MKTREPKFIRICFIMSVILCIASVACAAEPEGKPILSQLPDNARATLMRLFDLAESADNQGKGGDKLKRKHDKFQEVFTLLGVQIDDELAAQIKPSKEASDLYEKILIKFIRMARKHAKHGDRFADVVGRYWHGVGVPPNPSVAPRAPQLLEKHVNENYRLAWEYMVVAPRPTPQIYHGLPIAYEALTQIRNDKSIVVFVYAFSRLCREDIPQNENVAEHQMMIMSPLFEYHNEKSLEAILKCLSLSDAVGGPEADEDFLYEQVFEAFDLYTSRHSEAKKAWYAVIRKYPKEELPERQRQLLERVSKHLKP